MAVWDSTELTPDRKIPAICKELREVYKQPTLDLFREGAPRHGEEAYVKKGVLTLDKVGGEEIQLERVQVVIMNPPFTRQERVPESYKAKLVERLEDYPQDVLHGQLGLYGYFIPLADRFLQDGGRMAFVLPASVLRLQSTEGIRRFLLQKYHVEYVITAWQRAAFSEATEFREILLVAKKLPLEERKNNERRTTFVTLRKLPQSREEAGRFADEIREAPQRAVPFIENERMSILRVPHEELVKNVRNLFTFIAAYDKKLRELADQIILNAKLTRFADYLEKTRAHSIEGLESRKGMKVQSMFILRDKSRGDSVSDPWIADSIGVKDILVYNRFDRSQVKVPSKALRRALRSLSIVDSIDVGESNDYVVVDDFGQASKFFMASRYGKVKRLLQAWRGYVEDRLGTVIIMRRFDMSASGTKIFACCSQEALAGAGVTWNIMGLSTDAARILALWLNSTLNVLQVFLNRIETRGAWTNLHEYALRDLLVLDPAKLSEKQRQTLLDTFEEVKDIQFPSLLKQLHDRFYGRRKIDAAVMRTLGISQMQIKEMLDYLYPTLADEIERLKALMAGKGGEEEENPLEAEEED